MQVDHEMIVEPIGLNVDRLPKPIVWTELFGNDYPVEMEIGMGKGTFITEQAKGRPDVNFFGIEWARWYWRYCSDRLRRNQCLNARTVRAEANFFLTEFVQDQSLSVCTSTSRPVAQVPASQTPAHPGIFSAPGRAHPRAAGPIADRDRPPGVFRTD